MAASVAAAAGGIVSPDLVLVMAAHLVEMLSMGGSAPAAAAEHLAARFSTKAAV